MDDDDDEEDNDYTKNDDNFGGYLLVDGNRDTLLSLIVAIINAYYRGVYYRLFDSRNCAKTTMRNFRLFCVLVLFCHLNNNNNNNSKSNSNCAFAMMDDLRNIDYESDEYDNRPDEDDSLKHRRIRHDNNNDNDRNENNNINRMNNNNKPKSNGVLFDDPTSAVYNPLKNIDRTEGDYVDDIDSNIDKYVERAPTSSVVSSSVSSSVNSSNSYSNNVSVTDVDSVNNGNVSVDVCDCFSNVSNSSRIFQDATITLRHRILDTEIGLTAGVKYVVAINVNKSIRSLTIISQDEEYKPLGYFRHSTGGRKNCPNMFVAENKLEANEEILLNWSLPIRSSVYASTSITFRICYRLVEYDQTVFETARRFPINKDCVFHIRPAVGSIQSFDLSDGFSSDGDNCLLVFALTARQSESDDRDDYYDDTYRRRRGLNVKLTKLNVRCDAGYVKLFRESRLKLCGKLEEIPHADRQHYFPPFDTNPSIVIVGKPVFAVSYRRVDYCHNVTLREGRDNNVIEIRPLWKIFCNFKIAVPYGYLISITVRIVRTTSTVLTTNDSSSGFNNNRDDDYTFRTFTPIHVSADLPDKPCLSSGIYVRFWDFGVDRNSSYYCDNDNDDDRDDYYYKTGSVSEFRTVSVGNAFLIRLSSSESSSVTTGFRLIYETVPIVNVTGNCPFHYVRVNNACFILIDDVRLDWDSAEKECVRRGGHLASIVDEYSQYVVDQMIFNSPTYEDHNSYWIGATDISHEGDFRWVDTQHFTYTNWFGGWPQYGYHNRQPNDDGFSNQNCVELRRQYQISPPSMHVSNAMTAAFNGKRAKLTKSFMWNDRDCRVKNYFICEIFPSNNGKIGRENEVWKQRECNQNIALSEDNTRTVISSPDFPHSYPMNKNCHIQLTAPPDYNIIVVFEEFVLEDEASYDYLEMYEENQQSDNDQQKLQSQIANNNVTSNANENVEWRHERNRYCGDWSDRLKLLRYVSSTPKLYLHFFSDYSHSFSGYKAHVFIERAKPDCVDNRLQLFNDVCYLFVSYPQVTWQTAQDICVGIQGNLASVHSLEEEHFVVTKIRESHEYTASTIYWLGGRANRTHSWIWIDDTQLTFTAWLPTSQVNPHLRNNTTDSCLGIQWIPSPSSTFPSGLYWIPVSCQQTGGYVCKLENQSKKAGSNLNATINGTEGQLMSPNFPGYYYHNLDYWIRLVSPETSRIIIQFESFDLEEQKYCLYDFLEMYDIASSSSNSRNSASSNSYKKSYRNFEPVRRCGYHTHQLHRLNFVSTGNEALLRFHSDYSIARTGFSANWKAVDISGCPSQTLTAKEGIIVSPNYPNFLIANLQCTTTILAPVGRQVWLEFLDWDFGEKEKLEENLMVESDLTLFLGNKDKVYPFEQKSVLSDGAYLSYGEYVKILLRTGDLPAGSGFKARYKTVSSIKEERVIKLSNTTSGFVYHLNYPLKPISGIHYTERFIAPLGYSIHMQFFQVIPSLLDREFGRTVCPENTVGFIEVRDNYADQNGTWWQFCATFQTDITHLTITSYLNTLSITQTGNENYKGILLNASLTVIPDPNFKIKILQSPRNYTIDSCEPNPCSNGGKCVNQGDKKYCQCIGYFTGMFCALTICDISPCVFGVCTLTKDTFKCDCETGYQGTICDTKIRPCSTNPCEGRGLCIERNDVAFTCQCHAWWEGERCEHKIVNIPYKPLTERMLREPFWLGLLTVCVVLACIGLFWCAKRHFPEKLEKLLADESERNRPYTGPLSGRAPPPPPLRADLLGHNGIAANIGTPQANTTNSSPNPNTPRTLFGRLGIRKPSLFSLTSPLQPPASTTHTTSRTFSLDDLFKPSLSRSPSSYKVSKHGSSSSRSKRLSNGGGRKNFQQVQSSSSDKEQATTEYIPLKAITTTSNISTTSQNDVIVDKPKENSISREDTNTASPIFVFPKVDFNSDSKDGQQKSIKSKTTVTASTNELNRYEKKVTFARLLNKVQTEISSSSDVELNAEIKNDTVDDANSNLIDNRSSKRRLYQQTKSSVHSTSSNQGSDSLSSSEVTLMSASGEKLNVRRPSLLTLGTPGKCQKAVSADSILAMFRKFSLGTAATSSECNSNHVSASTSPTASSPPDDNYGGSLDSLSSYHLTPLSVSSGINESPPCTNRTHSSNVLQTQVSDSGSGHHGQKSNTNATNSNLLHPPPIITLDVPNKCLSPIHEVPTPIPSPSISPVFGRHYLSSAFNIAATNTPTTNTSSSQDSLDGRNQLCKPFGNNVKTQFLTAKSQQSPFRTSSSVIDSYPRITITNSDDTGSSSLTSDETAKTKSPLKNSRKPPLSKLVIPTFIVQEPSPTNDSVPSIFVQQPEEDEYADYLINEPHRISIDSDKSSPPPFEITPPMIMVTCMSELDSDTDSPANHKSDDGHGNPAGMCYLSPFTVCSRTGRIASESNLSSSGYSSMASPGPSRCGSNNPLCPSETDDRSDNNNNNNSNNNQINNDMNNNNNNDSGGSSTSDNRRLSGDSETMSDDHFIASNDDEGFATDNVDEIIHGDRVKSAKELENYQKTKNSIDDKNRQYVKNQSSASNVSNNINNNNSKSKSLISPSFQLPSIIVDDFNGARDDNNNNNNNYYSNYSNNNNNNNNKSPVSSRSESPVSDRTGLNRFSPMFYGKLTDSDGLYDCTSSDYCVKPIHRKHLDYGRKRDRYRSKSPAFTSPLLLDVPPSSVTTERGSRKSSPKRRVRSQQISPLSSSSSTDDNSKSRIYSRKSSSSPYRMKMKHISNPSSYSTEASGEDNAEDTEVKFGPSALNVMNVSIRQPEEKLVHSRTPQQKGNDKNDNDKYKDSTRIPLLQHSKSTEEQYANHILEANLGGVNCDKNNAHHYKSVSSKCKGHTD